VNSLVVAEYVGVKTPELNELRSKLRPVQGKCQIVKNRLAKIALKNRGIDDAFAEFFKGQSALVIQKGDAIAGLKVVVDFEKAHSNWKIRAGYLDGKVLKSAEVKAVASLPGRQTLLGMLAAGLNSPIQKLHGVMNAHLRNLVGVLDQVGKKKETAAK
jgi:large subunit ribosomal protein L10